MERHGEAESFLLRHDLQVTGKRPFAVGNDEWKQASELRVGDKVLGNSFTEIKGIERILQEVTVFNLSVDGTQHFFVSDGDNLYLPNLPAQDGKKEKATEASLIVKP